MSNVVQVFDTTLRDGEQAPGATLSTAEKILVADQLARLGVDVIEAGFPAASPGDHEAVSKIAQRLKGVAVAGLARATSNLKDVECAWDAVRNAEQPVIHTFISSSDIQIEYQLRKTREQVLDMAVNAVRKAKSYTSWVEFSAMDATRTDVDYLCTMFERTIEAGATVVNVPDTVGFAEPVEFADLIRTIFNRVPNIHKAVVSVHCHNDLGLGTANTLAAIREGAGQVEVTINGLGERAGNTALEEFVMALATRAQRFGNRTTRIQTEQLVPTSQLVSRLTSIPVQPNKAIVGKNAFSHESGIHQDGVLKNPLTYEIMTPQSVGWEQTQIVLGKHSGRHGFRQRLEQLGYKLDSDTLETAYQRFIAMTDERKIVNENDVIEMVQGLALTTVS